MIRMKKLRIYKLPHNVCQRNLIDGDENFSKYLQFIKRFANRFSHNSDKIYITFIFLSQSQSANASFYNIKKKKNGAEKLQS